MAYQSDINDNMQTKIDNYGVRAMCFSPLTDKLMLSKEKSRDLVSRVFPLQLLVRVRAGRTQGFRKRDSI